MRVFWMDALCFHETQRWTQRWFYPKIFQSSLKYRHFYMFRPSHRALNVSQIFYIPMSYSANTLQFPISFISADNNNCYVQTCKQRITGRNLRYSRILQIINNDQFFDDLDEDFLRRRRAKRQSEFPTYPYPTSSLTALNNTVFPTDQVTSSM